MSRNKNDLLRVVLRNLSANIITEYSAESSRSIVKNYALAKRKRKEKVLQILSVRKKKHKRTRIVKIPNYIVTIQQFSDQTFYSHFRMTRDCFSELVEEVKPFWKQRLTGGPRIDVTTALYMTLWWLSNENSFREISDRFNFSIGRVYEITQQICKIISKLSDKYIRWPSEKEMIELTQKFESLRPGNRFPSVVGYVDGTHVKIRSPSQNSQSYYNRKGYHSMILQGICDSDLIFRNVSFGWPGSCHDAAIWKDSSIGKKLASGEIKLINDAHLLGDSAYPLMPYLITPYRDNGFLSQNHKKFNYLHSSVRVCIEQAFGIMKSKFRIMNCLPITKLSNAKFIVLSCVVLHNFIRLKSHLNPIFVLEYKNIGEGNNINEDEYIMEEMQNSVTKRDVICEWLADS